MRILLSTSNKGKLKEIQGILGDSFEILLKSDFELDNFDVVEDLDTLEGNAEKKARELFKLTNTPVISDDTGLFVDALNGEPGVYSARYSGEDGNDKKNVELLLENLKEFTETSQRKAHFKTVICYINQDGEAKFVNGILEGNITFDPRGENGFGYDPVFEVEGRTLAELSSEEKNTISHRKRALAKLIDLIK